MQMSTLFVFTLAAALFLIANRKGSTMFALLGAMCAMLVPMVFVASRRLTVVMQRWEAERSIVRNTKAYLSTQESAKPHVPLKPRRGAEFPAFRPMGAAKALNWLSGELVVFDALPAQAHTCFAPAIPNPESRACRAACLSGGLDVLDAYQEQTFRQRGGTGFAPL